MKPKPYAKESDLCAAFTAAIGNAWVAYAETGGWDLLLVRKSDGFQIGVQAKLKLNTQVFAQAIEGGVFHVAESGPDCRAILVPWQDCQLGLGVFGPYVGVTIIRMCPPGRDLRRLGAWHQFEPVLPEPGKEWSTREWYELAPFRRHDLPAYVPDVVAGAAAPLQLTDWKISALKIAVLLEERGHVTRADFRSIGIDHRRWIAPVPGWLAVRDGRFVPGPGYPDFARQHPKVYAEIKTDRPKWAPQESGSLL